MTRPVLVTGATGTVGREVIRALQTAGVQVRAAVTDPVKARASLGSDLDLVHFVFGIEATYAPAFGSVDAVFLMRPPQISDARHLINPAIEAAKLAGVRAITFLSLQGAEHNPLVPHYAIERYLETSGLDYTFLRASFFMQNLATTHRDDICLHDDLMIPAGSGRTAFIDVRDIAAVAALTLTQGGHAGQAYELTGSEALTYDEVAVTLSEVLGRPISYAHPNVVQFWARLHERQQPVALVLVMTVLYAAAALGQAGHLTGEVRRLLGREPIRFLQFARDYAEVWRRESGTTLPVEG
ncbi:SDR family oxidoreductase [Deinococcus sp. UYEF24]